jgi:hypothetical protein
MANTYVALAKTVLTSTQATITFSSIPQTYTDLIISVSARSDSASNAFYYMRFNGSSTSFTNTYLEGNGSGTLASGSNFAQIGGRSQLTSETASTFSNGDIYIPNYTSANNKVYSSSNVSENNNSVAAMIYIAGLWSNTSAINEIAIAAASGNFISGSSFYLYGIKNS